MVKENGTLVHERRQYVHRVDDTERGVGDQLPCLDRPRVAEKPVGRPVVRKCRVRRMRVADGRRQRPQLLAGRFVRRPVVGMLRTVETGEIPLRWRGHAETMDMTEQVVAVFHAHPRDRVGRREGQVRAGETFQHFAVINMSAGEVSRHQVHQVQALAGLHPRGVERMAHQVTAVVLVNM